MDTITFQNEFQPEFLFTSTYNQKDLATLTNNVDDFYPNPAAFQSDQTFNIDCGYFDYQLQQDYTPSYDSPKNHFYESLDSSPSISDYEPSSSCTSGVSSPNLATESMIFDSQDRRGSFEYTQDELLQYDQGLNVFKQESISFNPFEQYQDLEVLACSHPTGSSSVGDLKLDINASSCIDQSNDASNYLLSPNTFAAQCGLQLEDNTQAPMFNFVAATPITPTKGSEVADNIFPFNASMQLPAIEDITSSQMNVTEQKNKQKHQQPSRSKQQSHRSHRKSLPSDMMERLHTMNLAPPKPVRKSKTCSPFSCPYEDCLKTFTRQYNLKSHLRTHTDERPFLCGYQGCIRAFARQHDRKRHYNLHLGFKPHVCNHCGRAFARLDALNRHLRSDSGAPCAQATLPNAGEKKFKPVNM